MNAFASCRAGHGNAPNGAFEPNQANANGQDRRVADTYRPRPVLPPKVNISGEFTHWFRFGARGGAVLADNIAGDRVGAASRWSIRIVGALAGASRRATSCFVRTFIACYPQIGSLLCGL